MNSLLEYFEGVFCTNSIYEIPKSFEHKKIKQLNVF
jgi:hypothetical protein